MSCSWRNSSMTRPIRLPHICHAYTACNARRRARERAAGSMPDAECAFVPLFGESLIGPLNHEIGHFERGERDILALVAVSAARARLGVGVFFDREHAVQHGNAEIQRDAHEAV